MSDERMTAERLAEIEARARAATYGPWGWEPTSMTLATEARVAEGCNRDCGCFNRKTGAVRSGERPCPAEIVLDTEPNGAGYGEIAIAPPDAAFIAHAREDVPDLLAEVRAQQSDVATLLEALRPFAEWSDELRATERQFGWPRGPKRDKWEHAAAISTRMRAALDARAAGEAEEGAGDA